MPDIIQIVLIALVAGAGGMVIGGVLGIIVKKPGRSYIGYMLSFAAGAMIGISIFELLPEALEHGEEMFYGGGIVAIIIGLALGALFVFLLELPMSKKQKTLDNLKSETLSNVLDEQLLKNDQQKRFRLLGIAVFIAIILHTFPEGLAIGAGYHVGNALVFGIVLMIHYIPEGHAIAVPLKAGGTNGIKIITLCFLAAVPTVLGAILGYYIGTIDWLLAFAFAFAAGAMIYIVLSEMLPTAYEYVKNKKLLAAIAMLGAVVLIVFSALL